MYIYMHISRIYNWPAGLDQKGGSIEPPEPPPGYGPALDGNVSLRDELKVYALKTTSTE